MAAFEQLSGMAGEIRAATASEEFDCAKMTETKISEVFGSAFANPLTTPSKMISFKFIVGGGKLVRAKYNEEMPKWVNNALRGVGYESDASAAETYDSQGTFKQQHDTGKNLIYIIVFPKVTCSASGGKDSGNGGDKDDEPLQDTKSPEYLCAASSLTTFKDMFNRKLMFWRQRKACLKILQDNKEQFQAIEIKMCSGQPLTPLENSIYESNSGEDDEKIAFVQSEIKKLVDNGELIASEKEELLNTLTNNAAEAEASGQKAKVANINARKEVLQKVTPIVGRLRLGDEICKWYHKLFPLQALEDKGRSMSLTIADLQQLSDKDDIIEKINSYIIASRGWFENDDDFQERCDYEEKQAKKSYIAKKNTKSTGKGLGSKSRVPTGTQSNRGTNLYKGALSMANNGRKQAAGGAGQGGKASSYADAFGSDSD